MTKTHNRHEKAGAGFPLTHSRQGLVWVLHYTNDLGISTSLCILNFVQRLWRKMTCQLKALWLEFSLRFIGEETKQVPWWGSLASSRKNA